MELFERFREPERCHDPHRDIVRLWSLRMLSWIGVGAILRETYRCCPLEELLGWLGLLPEDPQDQPPDSTQLSKKLVAQRVMLEKKKPEIVEPLKTNLELLAAALDLSEIERECLGFCVLLVSHERLREVVGLFSMTDSTILNDVVGTALGYQAHEVRRMFSRQGNLLTAGMIRLDFESTSASSVFCLMEGLVNVLGQPYQSAEEILGCFVDNAPGATLTQTDYPHLAQDSEILRGYLKGVRRSGLTGVNILVYGPPGTGKTEYVRMLAAEQGSRLFEVQSEKWPQGTLKPDDRLSACKFAQKLLANTPDTILLFDEIEDVLDSWAQLFAKSHVSKQRINRILEHNAVPTFWVCNNHRVVAPWQLRRFDYVLRMPCPPKSIRHKIAEQAFVELNMPASDIKAIAKEGAVAPAHIVKASRVALAAQQGGYADAGVVVQRSLTNRLKALDQRHQLCVPKSTQIPLSLDFYNTDCDLKPLLDRLVRNARGRVCLYGPPGTGKTSLARIIAETVDRTLISRQASDLLSCYIGETEKNIRRMFEEAIDEDAVLLIDEIESFISDRSYAQRNWEISQVNEMLVGLESFDGLVIGATNFFERLDSAALRRFDFKIELGYLKSDQVKKMFDALRKRNETAQTEIPGFLQRQLRGLTCLTPGDFAVVARRMQILGSQYSPEELVAVLAAECINRETHEIRIGFMASV